MFDFRRKTLFCLEYRLSKHKLTIPKILGRHGPLAPLATPAFRNLDQLEPCVSFVFKPFNMHFSANATFSRW